MMVACFGCTLQVLPQDVVVWNVDRDLFARTLYAVLMILTKKTKKKPISLLLIDPVIVVGTLQFRRSTGHVMWMQGVSDHGDLGCGWFDRYSWMEITIHVFKVRERIFSLYGG
jgi:uncharacterized protein YodC (DUF2158 family)